MRTLRIVACRMCGLLMKTHALLNAKTRLEPRGARTRMLIV
ncbi:hypothetical protein HMPREF3232_01323 [Fannyhessea vaginae]|nr:hypothetical protein HMPREF3232_01323 [Fannyhessea vaginae]